MLKDVFIVGFAVLEIINHQYGSSYDRKFRPKLRELYPVEYTDYYLSIYWAQAITYFVIGFVFSGLLLNAIGPIGFVMGIGLGVGLFIISLKGLDERVRGRHLRISIDMPELTNKIIILSGAGLTIKQAIVKISNEMTKEPKMELYAALEECVDAIDIGANDTEAFSHLTDKCNTPAMRRFCSVILQNMKFGGGEVIRALTDIGREQWNDRKNACEKLTMEAETKLLYPMMLMLFAVIVVTVAPALLSMM